MIFKEHPAFVPPENSEYKIWRYMDFTKFVSMMVKQSLYFTSLKKMAEQDPFEGLLPDTYFQFRSWKTVDDIPNHERWRLTLRSLTGQSPLEMVKTSMEEFARHVFHFRKTLYVNCWHMNNYESTAMWSIYTGKGSGIAITSSYETLAESLQSSAIFFGGKIIYSDYATDIIDVSNNVLSMTMKKRRSFDFEKEFRVVFWDDSHVGRPGALEELSKVNVPDGREFRCDLATLIDEIYVSPKSEEWYLDLVQSVVQTYGLSKKVRRSPLDVRPIL